MGDMVSTDTDHTDTVQESLDTQVPLPPTLPEAYKDLANRFLYNIRTEVRIYKRKMQLHYLFLLDNYLLTNPIFVIILIISFIIPNYLLISDFFALSDETEIYYLLC